jgi:hypothetical protein
MLRRVSEAGNQPRDRRKWRRRAGEVLVLSTHPSPTPATPPGRDEIEVVMRRFWLAGLLAATVAMSWPHDAKAG